MTARTYLYVGVTAAALTAATADVYRYRHPPATAPSRYIHLQADDPRTCLLDLCPQGSDHPMVRFTDGDCVCLRPPGPALVSAVLVTPRPGATPDIDEVCRRLCAARGRVYEEAKVKARRRAVQCTCGDG